MGLEWASNEEINDGVKYERSQSETVATSFSTHEKTANKDRQAAPLNLNLSDSQKNGALLNCNWSYCITISIRFNYPKCSHRGVKDAEPQWTFSSRLLNANLLSVCLFLTVIQEAPGQSQLHISSSFSTRLCFQCSSAKKLVNRGNDRQIYPSLVSKNKYFLPRTMLKSDKRCAPCTKSSHRVRRDLCQTVELSVICRAEGEVLEIRPAKLTQQSSCQGRWPLGVLEEWGDAEMNWG